MYSNAFPFSVQFSDSKVVLCNFKFQVRLKSSYSICSKTCLKLAFQCWVRPTTVCPELRSMLRVLEWMGNCSNTWLSDNSSHKCHRRCNYIFCPRGHRASCTSDRFIICLMSTVISVILKINLSTTGRSRYLLLFKTGNEVSDETCSESALIPSQMAKKSAALLLRTVWHLSPTCALKDSF